MHLFLCGVRRRLLMPPVRPLSSVRIFLAIPLLNVADVLIVMAFDLLPIIIGAFAILRFGITCERHPFSLFLFMRFSRPCERVIAPLSLSYRSGPVISNFPMIDHYGETIGNSLVRIAQVGGIDPVAFGAG